MTWAEAEVQELYELREQGLSVKEIAAELNRSTNSVQSKIFREKKGKSYKRFWSKEEDKRLKQLCQQGMFLKEAHAHFPGRSQNAVCRRARVLGIGFSSPHAWTQEELMLLEALAGEKPLSLIQEKLSRRTQGGIAAKMERLGISTIPELDYWTPAELGRLIGVTGKTIHYWIQKHGLKSSKKPPRHPGNKGVQNRVFITRKAFRKFYDTHKNFKKIRTLKTINPEVLDWIFDTK